MPSPSTRGGTLEEIRIEHLMHPRSFDIKCPIFRGFVVQWDNPSDFPWLCLFCLFGTTSACSRDLLLVAASEMWSWVIIGQQNPLSSPAYIVGDSQAITGMGMGKLPEKSSGHLWGLNHLGLSHHYDTTYTNTPPAIGSGISKILRNQSERAHGTANMKLQCYFLHDTR